MIIKLTRLFAIFIALATSVAHAQTELKNVAASALRCSYGSSPGLSPSAIASLPPSGLFATVRAVIDPQGHVQDAHVEISSGNTTFDSAALQQSREAKCHPFVDADGNRAAAQTTFTFQVMPGQSHHARGDASRSMFAAAVTARLAKNMAWGRGAQEMSAVIAIHCEPDGHILSVEIVRSSGDPELDKRMVAAAQRSDPMPQDANGKTPAKFNVTFRLGMP